MNRLLAFVVVLLLGAWPPLALSQDSEEIEPASDEPVSTGEPASADPGRPSLEILTIDTRPGVTMRIVWGTPASLPNAALVLFPGGNGAGHFSERGGQVRLGGNFLVRSTNLFLENGLAVAIVDTPSDQPDGMSGQFRAGEAHTEDVRVLVRMLAERWSSPVYLVGTSAGTISAAHVASSLGEPAVQGVVLTATVARQLGPRATGVSVASLPVERIGLPVLLVHHRDDGCSASLHADAVALSGRLTGAPRVDFTSVVGGDPPRSEPCDALSPHGFLGRERDVVAAIAAWIAGRPVPPEV